MLIWMFLLGVIFSFIIPAINFYLSEKNIAYIFYVLYILFSGVFVLFTFVKFNGLVLFSSDLSILYDYERIFNSIPALFYYLFLWYYVSKSDRTIVYRKVLKWLLTLTAVLVPVLSFLDVFKFSFINEKLLTSIGGLVVLLLVLLLCFLLLKDKKRVFKIVGLGFLVFSILVISSLAFYAFSDKISTIKNPHLFYLIGIILELTLLNYALNLSNLAYREKLILENNQLEGLALRSQMNPHFVHNSLNAIQYYIQRNEIDLSEDYLVKFSKLVRTFFEYSRKKTITIQNEIDMLENYLQIEKLRFEEKLNFMIKVDEQLETEERHIPSMILQPVVENAVNHGIFHKSNGGNIIIHFKYVDELSFMVYINDDGIGINKSKEIYKNSTRNYRSNSTEVLKERLHLLQQSKLWYIDYKITDLSEVKEKEGTQVSITFKKLMR